MILAEGEVLAPALNARVVDCVGALAEEADGLSRMWRVHDFQEFEDRLLLFAKHHHHH